MAQWYPNTPYNSRFPHALPRSSPTPGGRRPIASSNATLASSGMSGDIYYGPVNALNSGESARFLLNPYCSLHAPGLVAPGAPQGRRPYPSRSVGERSGRLVPRSEASDLPLPLRRDHSPLGRTKAPREPGMLVPHATTMLSLSSHIPSTYFASPAIDYSDIIMAITPKKDRGATWGSRADVLSTVEIQLGSRTGSASTTSFIEQHIRTVRYQECPSVFPCRALVQATANFTLEASITTANGALAVICPGCLQRRYKKFDGARDERLGDAKFQELIQRSAIDLQSLKGGIEAVRRGRIEVKFGVPCYSSHQHDATGYRIGFRVKDSAGRVVVSAVSQQLLHIYRDKKEERVSKAPSAIRPLNPPVFGPSITPGNPINPMFAFISPHNVFQPAITAIHPSRGDWTGFYPVQIFGPYFDSSKSYFVWFGSTSTKTTWSSDGVLTCMVPPNEQGGVVQVRVATDGVWLDGALAFEYSY